ncbi:hypothetical protein BST36_00130 [Mycolicibacterium moriokaense]|uniref:Uncharacterized protein n=1 Tax=Mycolicibacterium moriokaense TaxID=39691 RepID=A0AAD1H8P5_9MYCO|nr:hypothetical protein [Mycolicibacterium moriokaense]MCV7041269.1 hypothetical protein [Mycolicibacterium moriokaense]ORB27137.1 hypothetical protein BST36_00130 [Mycolicibacterium moriokaense]BBX00835.1 hypothetical protein MMOR_17710 [Mycolicibacterium moriokaense]
MKKNIARFIVAPIAAAGIAAGALGMAAVASANDSVQAVPNLMSSHTGPAHQHRGLSQGKGEVHATNAGGLMRIVATGG